MMHRTAHQVTYLYRTIHSWHHRLYVPYAFGALYNHPFEGFALDTCGSVLAHELVGFTTRQALLFFIVSTMKTVDDHCGFAFPWDPFQHVTGNNADYHDIHRALPPFSRVRISGADCAHPENSDSPQTKSPG